MMPDLERIRKEVAAVPLEKKQIAMKASAPRHRTCFIDFASCSL